MTCNGRVSALASNCLALGMRGKIISKTNNAKILEVKKQKTKHLEKEGHFIGTEIWGGK